MQDDDEAAFDAELAALAAGSAQVGPFPLPRWVRGGSVEQPAIDGYVCDDPQAMRFALGVLITTGFGIVDFDVWLASIGECGAQRELRVRRELAEDALRENKQDVMRGHLEWMYLRRRAIERETALLPLAKRDAARQEGTRKRRRRDVDAWIDAQLKANPAAKSPALWSAAPEWITEQIGEERFAKRVTDARKRVASK